MNWVIWIIFDIEGYEEGYSFDECVAFTDYLDDSPVNAVCKYLEENPGHSLEELLAWPPLRYVVWVYDVTDPPVDIIPEKAREVTITVKGEAVPFTVIKE